MGITGPLSTRLDGVDATGADNSRYLSRDIRWLPLARLKLRYIGHTALKNTERRSSLLALLEERESRCRALQKQGMCQSKRTDASAAPAEERRPQERGSTPRTERVAGEVHLNIVYAVTGVLGVRRARRASPLNNQVM